MKVYGSLSNYWVVKTDNSLLSLGRKDDFNDLDSKILFFLFDWPLDLGPIIMS